VLFFLAAGSILAQAPLPDAWVFREVIGGNLTAYSPDGKYLAVGTPGAIQVYSNTNVDPVRGINTNVSTLASMMFSPDSKTMLVAGNYVNGTGWVELWNVSTGKLASSFQSDKGGVTAASFSPDGKTIAVAGSDGKNVLLGIFQVSNHALVTTFATKLSAINSVTFTPSGNSLAAGGSNGTVGSTELWNLQTNKLISTLISEAPLVTQVVISNDGNYLATGGSLAYGQGAKVELFSLSTNTRVVSYPSTAQAFVGMAFAPDSQTLFSTGGTLIYNRFGSNWGTQYESWSIPNLTLNQSSLQYYNSFGSAMSPDGTTITTCGPGYITETHQTTVGTYGFLNKLGVSSPYPSGGAITGSTGASGPYQPPGHAFAPPVFSPRGTTLIGGGLNAWSGTASIWESASGEWLGSVPNPSQSFGSAFAYAPDGETYAAAYSGTIDIFNSKDNSQLFSFAASNPTICSMKYSPDGTMIALGGLNANGQGFVDIWSAKTGALVSTMNTAASVGVNEVDFSPDGKTLVSWWRVIHDNAADRRCRALERDKWLSCIKARNAMRECPWHEILSERKGHSRWRYQYLVEQHRAARNMGSRQDELNGHIAGCA
jgi:WD40 repeat protein